MRRALLAAGAIAAMLLLQPAATLAQHATVTSTTRGVTVKITPDTLAADAETWVFSVSLDAHSQELADDLVNSVVLVTGDGRELRPSAWTGQPPGGHHRDGKLEFRAPKPAPKTVELRMRRVGETAPRTFRWTR